MIKNLIQGVLDSIYKPGDQEKGGSIVRILHKDSLFPLPVFSSNDFSEEMASPVKANYKGEFPDFYMKPDDESSAIFEIEDRCGYMKTVVE